MKLIHLSPKNMFFQKNIFIILFVLLASISFSQVNLEQPNVQTPVTPPMRIPDGSEISNPEIDKVISIVNTVEEKNNFIDQLVPDSNVSLPFGIVKQIGTARYVIAIDSMKFQPQGAYFSAYAAIDFPGTTKKIAKAIDCMVA